MISQITQTLATFWSLFTQVRVPGLGIPFSVLYLGMFAISVSIKLLAPILGLGGNVAQGSVRLGRDIRSDRSRRRRDEYAKRQSENTHYVIMRR